MLVEAAEELVLQPDQRQQGMADSVAPARHQGSSESSWKTHILFQLHFEESDSLWLMILIRMWSFDYK